MTLTSGKRQRYPSNALSGQLFRLTTADAWSRVCLSIRRSPGADKSRMALRTVAPTAWSTSPSSVPQGRAAAGHSRRIRGRIGAVLPLLLLVPVWASAQQDPPKSADELWSRIPSYELNTVKAGAGLNADPKFCRSLFKDLQHDLQKFHRIPPELETKTFDDPRLQEILPGCTRKNLTFYQQRDPNRGGAVTEGIYQEENFALWPMSMIDPNYPSNTVFVWRGPLYSFEDDKDAYLKPAHREGMNKDYWKNGEVDGIKRDTCDIVPKYSFNAMSKYKPSNEKIRNIFFVKYNGEYFSADVSSNPYTDPYITIVAMDENGVRMIDSPKNCFFYNKED